MSKLSRAFCCPASSTKARPMDLKQHCVFEEYYRGLKANGWPKDEAAKAARRHVNRMTPRQVQSEVDRILSTSTV